MSDSILPCPFCGKAPTTSHSRNDSDGAGQRLFSIRCCVLMVEGTPWEYNDLVESDEKAKRILAGRWNTRAQPVSEPKPVENVSPAQPYPLSDYAQDQWWIAELDKTWKDSNHNHELKRACLVATQFARAVFAGRSALLDLTKVPRYFLTAQDAEAAYPDDDGEWVMLPNVIAALNGEPIPPVNCRQRLQAEGKSYPRSGCEVCGKWYQRAKQCDTILSAQGFPPGVEL